MSVRRAQQEISSREFSEWIAYDWVEPFGPDRDDLRQGITSAMLYNSHRPRGSRVADPSDYVLSSDRTGPDKVSDEELERKMNAWARAHNEKVRRKRESSNGNNHR